MLAKPGIFLIARVPDESGEIVLKQNLNGLPFNLTTSPLQSSWSLWFFMIKHRAKKCLCICPCCGLWDCFFLAEKRSAQLVLWQCLPAMKMKGNCECCEDITMPQWCCVWWAPGGNRCILLLHSLLTLTYQGWIWTCIYWQTHAVAAAMLQVHHFHFLCCLWTDRRLMSGERRSMWKSSLCFTFKHIEDRC